MSTVDIGKLSGLELIAFEEATGVKFLVATAEIAAGEPSAKVLLGLAWLWRRRDLPELSWDEHVGDDSEVSLVAVVEDEVEGADPNP